jgi:hypothetical protein
MRDCDKQSERPRRWTVSWVQYALTGMIVVSLVSASSAAWAETPGERFRKVMEREAEYCATHKIKPTNRRCDITKLQPADPLATEEGRFAHSIKIPNPVAENSGYKPSMTPQEYFDHLCKTEAGDFIYKTVKNVDGILQMRPRAPSSYGANHLYALEDPYGSPYGSNQPEIWFVGPHLYRFFESPDLSRREPEGLKDFMNPSYFTVPATGAKIARYFGYDGREQRTMQKEYDAAQKSIYGYTWRGISRPNDREMGVAGSELIVLDIRTNEVLGVHRAYARFDINKNVAGTAAMQWWQRCPTGPNMGGGARLSFILKLLIPPSSQGK